MRSYRLDAGAGLDGLRLEVSEPPVPGPGEALVAVRAASLGHRAVMILEDRYVLPVHDGGIRPVLDDRVFAFDDAPAAFAHHLGGTARGRFVITIATDNGRN